MPTPPLYSDRALRRLLPNAASCANGDAAPLFTLPLIRNPSAPPRSASPAADGWFTIAAPAADALTCARWNPGAAAAGVAAAGAAGRGAPGGPDVVVAGRPVVSGCGRTVLGVGCKVRIICSSGSTFSSIVDAAVPGATSTSRADG